MSKNGSLKWKNNWKWKAKKGWTHCNDTVATYDSTHGKVVRVRCNECRETLSRKDILKAQTIFDIKYGKE